MQGATCNVHILSEDTGLTHIDSDVHNLSDSMGSWDSIRDLVGDMFPHHYFGISECVELAPAGSDY